LRSGRHPGRRRHVTIENINWHLEHGKDVETSIMDGAQLVGATCELAGEMTTMLGW